MEISELILEHVTLNWFRELKNSVLGGQEQLSGGKRVKDADGIIKREVPCLPQAGEVGQAGP